jgi:uncharacterized coiled-coil protein SlyX
MIASRRHERRQKPQYAGAEAVNEAGLPRGVDVDRLMPEAELRAENERLRGEVEQLVADKRKLIERLKAHLDMLLAKWELSER